MYSNATIAPVGLREPVCPSPQWDSVQTAYSCNQDNIHKVPLSCVLMGRRRRNSVNGVFKASLSKLGLMGEGKSLRHNVPFFWVFRTLCYLVNFTEERQNPKSRSKSQLNSSLRSRIRNAQPIIHKTRFCAHTLTSNPNTVFQPAADRWLLHPNYKGKTFQGSIWNCGSQP